MTNNVRGMISYIDIIYQYSEDFIIITIVVFMHELFLLLLFQPFLTESINWKASQH